MKKTLAIFFVFLLLVSCNQIPKDDGTSPAPLFPKSQSIEANPKGGYVINPVTGDSIKTIINSLGDTVITGKLIPVKAKFIHPDSVLKPKVVKAPAIENLEKYNAHPNRHKLIDNIPTKALNISQIKTIKFGEGASGFVLINTTGDTIPTGVPIPTKGKIVKALQTKPTKALLPAFKDAAIANIKYLDVDQGMLSSYIYCALEDNKGNLWFGTYSGVSVYNGESFRHYTEKEGLSNNYVLSILEDKKGNIWLGTYGGGVSVYDGECFKHFTEKEGLSHNIVRSILEDKKGNIWLGTNGGGVSIYEPSKDGQVGTFTHFTEKEGLSNNIVLSILEDKKGNIWLGTSGGGVSVYDGEKFRCFTEKEGLSNNIVLSILEDKKGNIWLGTDGGGVNVYNGKSFMYFTEKEGLSNNYVWSILEDKKGNIWLGTNGGGMSVYDGESFVHFTDREGLSNNYIRSILEDEMGNIWLGTNGGGVSEYDGESFIHFTNKEGLSNNIVWSVLEDKKGNIWLGTSGGGVSIYNSESFSYITEKEGLSNNYVRSILEDKKGNIWLVTNGGGVSVYDGKSFIYFTEKEGLSSNYVRSILEDKKGNIWLGTSGGGVSIYEPSKDAQVGTFTHFTEKEGLSNNYVLSILEDKKGNIWLGTSGGGVSVYEPPKDGQVGTFTHFTEKEGLSNNYILSILEDKKGNIWLGTSGGGVSVYDGKSFIHFTEKEGLNHNIVWSILEDKMGNIWLGTEMGIGFKLQNINEIVNTSGAVFTKQDGLKGLDFYHNSAFIDNKNRPWWGTGKGLTMLDLNNFQLSQSPPLVYLNQLDINEEFIDYHNFLDSLDNEIAFDSVQKFENYPINLSLPYHKNHLTFHFSGIDWSAPHKIQYSYRMLGLNDKWSVPSHEAKADYRNLPYNTFTFQIRAIGESEEWSEPFNYTFKINPPWWHTWWARALYALFALTLILALIRWRTSALKKRQKELEKTVEERTTEVVQQKELIEIKHKEITDSINYAERIQRSFLATKELLDKNLTSADSVTQDYFVFFKPKDVVSGDFYWASKLNNGNFAICCADSTGHGVPGAIMSILNISSLEKAIENEAEPHQILFKTREIIIKRLKKDGSLEGGKDGMDCSLVVINPEKTKISFALAQNPIWIVRNGEIIEFKPDKMPVGKHDKDHLPFTLYNFDVEKGDIIYTLTDGMPDQFGGPKGKKFLYKNLKYLIVEISDKPMAEQNEILSTTLKNWKGHLEQVDDICVIGIRI